MPRLSRFIEKLETRAKDRVGKWIDRHKAKLPLYIPLALAGWYVYGIFLNSVKLGIASTFHISGQEAAESLLILNPFKNWVPTIFR